MKTHELVQITKEIPRELVSNDVRVEVRECNLVRGITRSD